MGDGGRRTITAMMTMRGNARGRKEEVHMRIEIEG